MDGRIYTEFIFRFLCFQVNLLLVAMQAGIVTLQILNLGWSFNALCRLI